MSTEDDDLYTPEAIEQRLKQRAIRYHEAELDQLIKEGWKIVSDGPSGVQLSGPKKMHGADQLCLVFGILTFWIYGLGFIFIVIAMLDYWFMTKPEMKFLRRPPS
jgi:hypothetical protein